MIVIGSTALSQHGFEVEPNDLDLVGTYEEAQTFRKAFRATVFYPINSGKSLFMKNAQGEIAEVEIAWDGSRAAGFLTFAENNPQHFKLDALTGWLVPSMNVLYMLKMSHRYLKDSPHFLKTMRSIQTLRFHGCEITEDIRPYYLKRMAETYTYSHPKLDVSKGEFFDSDMTGVFQLYEHDDIHEAVKHLERPAYTYFKPDENEVHCSRDIFKACPREVQLYSFVEEAMVLALERSLVPYPNGKTPREAFEMGMMKICTSIASGWWREAAWESYDDAMALYSDDYVEKFKKGVEKGIVRRKED